MTRYTKHIFICENIRPTGHPRGCCSEKGSEEIKEKFKAGLKAHGLNTRCRANTAGCLDACEFGPTVVVYPEGVWYGGVSKDDVEEIIVEHVIGGKPVRRLLIMDERYAQGSGTADKA